MTASQFFTIRAATRDDLPAIVVMRDRLNALELAGSPHAPIQKLSLPEFTADWGGTFDSPNHRWLIVDRDARPVGFGLIYLIRQGANPPGGFIHWAYVEEECRGHGIGQALLDDMIAWARAQHANRIELQFIEGNHIAQQFWSKMGFEPFARKCVHYLK